MMYALSVRLIWGSAMPSPDFSPSPQTHSGLLGARSANPGAGRPFAGTSERPVIREVAMVTKTRTFTTADRCDRCSAQAHIRADLPNGFELLLCAHHGRKHHAALAEVAVRIENENAEPTRHKCDPPTYPVSRGDQWACPDCATIWDAFGPPGADRYGWTMRWPG